MAYQAPETKTNASARIVVYITGATPMFLKPLFCDDFLHGWRKTLLGHC